MTPIEHLNLHMGFSDANQDKRWRRYYEPVETLSVDLPAPILGVMLLVWQFREADLQQAFPLDSFSSRVDFLLWCACHGRKEYAAIAQADNYWNALSEKATLSPSFNQSNPSHAITKLMMLVREARNDLPFDISNDMGRAQFVIWYLTHGLEELGITIDPIPRWQIDYFNSPSEIPGLNSLQKLVYDARPDLQEAFTLPTTCINFLAWYDDTFMTSSMKSLLQTSDDRSRFQAPLTLSRGVNVIGYAFGQLGIGEDARMATKSLIAAGVKTNLINFRPGDAIPQNDFSMSEYVRNEIAYDTNIFCLTAIETARYFAENGARNFSSTFNIGYWPWELEEWPREWRHLYSLVDEVWASSMHTYKSVFSQSDVPVKHLPMAVAIPEASRLTRSDFSLPDKAKLFLFSFDLNSSANRKNPSACVEAFLSAFPVSEHPDSSKVGLVIKIHPPTGLNLDWEKLRSLREQDSRIHIIESTLSREDLIALYKICDCFISLHRAEGFGRNIAESMLLGTPVITTAYSGNLDYTNHLNSYLIDFDKVSLTENDYPNGEGQFWAEPSVDHAARSMRAVVDRPDEFTSIVNRARRQIEINYDYRVVGARYAFELNRIWQLD